MMQSLATPPSAAQGLTVVQRLEAETGITEAQAIELIALLGSTGHPCCEKPSC
jgi:hypothetical protein